MGINLFSDLYNKKSDKIVLNRALALSGKVVVLDRQVVKYLTQSERYASDLETISFINKFKEDYDKSCNVITLMTAFYEGGSGDFENASEKRRTANWDLKGLDNCFKFAQVDEKYFFKNFKKALHAFTRDSSIQRKNKQFSNIIHLTYQYYLELVKVDFNGTKIIEYAKLLKDDMDNEGVSVGDPVAQYCFSLLTNYTIAKDIFKVKGLQNCSREKISKKIYNAYADLRVIQFLNEFRSHIAAKGINGIEVRFISNDTALNKFNSELEKSVKKCFSGRNKIGCFENIYRAEINFDIFNQNVFSEEEFETFKSLFFDWSDI